MSTKPILAAWLSISVAMAACALQSGAHAQGTSERPESAGEGSAQSASAASLSLRTRLAQFVPTTFDQLPGWREDDLIDAWKAFRESCSALATRSAWSDMCARSRSVPVRTDEVRRFFEHEFVLYQIRNPDQSSAGVITGYYEPLLNGSRRRTGRFVYPVYGIPDDLLYLDARSLQPLRRGEPTYVRVSGRTVTALPPGGAYSTALNGVYVLDIAGARPDVRDRRMRVRIEGERIVPYYTRAQIEERPLAAEAIVWVDDASALYSMQIQGSGKVRLPDGKIVRVAYAEQNGHPFQPPVLGSARAAGQSQPQLPQTRGIPLQAALADEAPLTRGLKAGNRGGSYDLTGDVARVVEMLLHGSTAPAPAPRTKAPASSGPPPASREAGQRGAPTGASWFSSDPSYVFFREVADSAAGPIGALGVPLTAGRSIAVDPRTTPLGFPVFVSARPADGSSRLNRLMLAQDTGGAIRGAVRADYFWGFGPAAGERAARMKHVGSMWLLLPRDQALSARLVQSGTRGLSRDSDVECVIPDPEMCVE